MIDKTPAMPGNGEIDMKDAQLTIRINSELKKQTQAIAESQNRTLGNLIEYLLKQEIEKASRE